jgi:hypothetical protein
VLNSCSNSSIRPICPFFPTRKSPIFSDISSKYIGIIIVEIRLTQRIVQTIIENLRGKYGKTVANNSNIG